MTDSVERPPEENTNEAIQDRMSYYGRKHPEERTEFEDLPTWVRTAAAMKYLTGLTWKEVAKRVGKSPKTINGYTKSPAFKQWKKELEDASKDSKTMAEMVLKASSLGVTLEYLAAYEKAIEAADYSQVGKMSQDLLDRVGITKKRDKSGDGSIVVKLQLPGGGMAALEPPKIEAEWEEVEEPSQDVEIVDE